MKERKASFASAKEILRLIIPDEKYGETSALKILSGAWSSVIPGAVRSAADSSKPLKIEDAVLMIAVDNPLWAGELNFYRREMLERIAVLVPGRTVKDIRFVTKEPRRT